MKITRIETIPVRVPIKPALAIRGGRGLSHSVSPFLLVKLHTDEGIVGVGEASCTARWSGEDQVTAAHFVNFAPPQGEANLMTLMSPPSSWLQLNYHESVHEMGTGTSFGCLGKPKGNWFVNSGHAQRLPMGARVAANFKRPTPSNSGRAADEISVRF